MKRIQRLKIALIKAKIKLTGLFSPQKAAQQLFTIFCTPYATTQRGTAPQAAVAVEFLLNNKIIKGHRWNHPQEKKVLLIHGFNSAAHKFDHYVAPLVQKGYEVLSFDAPAHGSSQGKTTHALEYCQMITAVVENFGPVNNFIAHSFGGLAVSLALEKIPHNANTKLVFIAPATETATAIEFAFKMFAINSAAVRSAFENIILSISGHNIKWFSVRRAVTNIKATTLWLHDEDDDITPLSDAIKVKEDNNPHLQFIITKGLGHRRIYHDAAVKKAIIDFL